jgi:hypothetical protein
MTLRRGFISDNRADFGVQRICQVLQFSRSGFYWWIAGAKAREMRQATDDFWNRRSQSPGVHDQGEGSLWCTRTPQKSTRGATLSAVS